MIMDSFGEEQKDTVKLIHIYYNDLTNFKLNCFERKERLQLSKSLEFWSVRGENFGNGFGFAESRRKSEKRAQWAQKALRPSLVVENNFGGGEFE